MLGCKVHLFTVTRASRAKEVGSTNVVKAVEAFDPNAINKCRSKNMGIIGMIKRLLALLLANMMKRDPVAVGFTSGFSREK